MIILDYSDRRPIYEQVIAKLEELILRGVLEENAPLPSVRQLAMDLAINPNTVQRAYFTLEKEGWIYSVKGRGSFVASGDKARSGRRAEVMEKLAGLCQEAHLAGVTGEELIEAIRKCDVFVTSAATDGTAQRTGAAAAVAGSSVSMRNGAAPQNGREA